MNILSRRRCCARNVVVRSQPPSSFSPATKLVSCLSHSPPSSSSFFPAAYGIMAVRRQTWSHQTRMERNAIQRRTIATQQTWFSCIEFRVTQRALLPIYRETFHSSSALPSFLFHPFQVFYLVLVVSSYSSSLSFCLRTVLVTRHYTSLENGFVNESPFEVKAQWFRKLKSERNNNRPRKNRLNLLEYDFWIHFLESRFFFSRLLCFFLIRFFPQKWLFAHTKVAERVQPDLYKCEKKRINAMMAEKKLPREPSVRYCGAAMRLKKNAAFAWTEPNFVASSANCQCGQNEYVAECEEKS